MECRAAFLQSYTALFDVGFWIQLRSNIKFKGIFRDHSRDNDNALKFHKIKDFCILVMVLDV